MILAASQRLSVSIIMATIVAAAGAMMRQRVDPSFGIACERAASRGAEDAHQAASQRAGDGLGVGAERQQAAIVVRTAKPAIQSRMRPTGYHSSAGAAGAAPLPAAGIGDRPAQQREMAEPPGRQRDRDDKGDAVGQAEHRAEAEAAAMPPIVAAERSPSDRRHHQRQRRQIEQQQRDQRARDDRGEHQRRRSSRPQGQ